MRYKHCIYKRKPQFSQASHIPRFLAYYLKQAFDLFNKDDMKAAVEVGAKR